jgi:putative ABC transport system permease protein
MLHNYWKIAIRSLLRHRLHNLLLVGSMSAGLTCAIVVYLFVRHEFRYDTFHEKADRIYRIQQNRYNKNELTNSSVAVNFGVGPDMATDIPEVAAYVNMRRVVGGFINRGEFFRTEKAAAASSEFFRIFSFPLLRGVDSLVLSRPFTAVVSESYARKAFKDEDPIGKIYRYRTGIDLEITGIFADMPETSHMDFDLLLSMETHNKVAARTILEEPWKWDGYFTYILLHRADQAEAVKAKIPDLIERKTGDWLRETDQKLEINLQPLTDIHLYSHFKDEWKENGNYQVVFFLGATALAILVITWLTFTSLATVRALGRSRETGIRKVLGSSRFHLAMQFLLESFLLNTISFALALSIVYLGLPQFSELFNRNLAGEIIWSPVLVGWLLLALIISSAISGLYPALVISSIAPSEILKGRYLSGKAGQGLRKVMVFIPFTATVILLISVLVIYLQLDLMRSRDLGFDLDRLVVVRNSEIFDSLYQVHSQAFRKEITQLAGVENATMVSGKPGTLINFYSNSVRRISAPPEDINQYRYFFIDEQFAETMGLQVLAGRSVGSSHRRDKDVMINELACTLLGFSSPAEAIGEKVIFRDDTVRITAVLNNYHHQSPKTPIVPTFFVYNPERCNNYLIRLAPGASVPEQDIDRKFRSLFTAEVPTIALLRDEYHSQYEAESRFNRIVLFFAIVLIAISCAGLFTISSYAARLRAREVGIRKVMGATTGQATLLLLKEYAWLLLFSLAVGITVAVMVLERWLESFTLRVHLTWWMVAVPAAGALLIALLTIIRQTLRAANTNPAEVLRYE